MMGIARVIRYQKTGAPVHVYEGHLSARDDIDPAKVQELKYDGFGRMFSNDIAAVAWWSDYYTIKGKGIVGSKSAAAPGKKFGYKKGIWDGKIAEVEPTPS